MAVNLPEADALLPVAGVRLASTTAIKMRRRDDLTVVALDRGCHVAGVFTQNRFPAAPIILCREHLARRSPSVRALAINAGIANAGTLGGGLRDARESCRLLAHLLQCRPNQVLPFSTGVIMERLPMARYAEGLARCVGELSEQHWLPAARAIMTTDTVAKGRSLKVGEATVTGIAKGSGMIHPNMATMLSFVATDATISPSVLARWQRQITAESFNAITIDGDTSTNDSFLLMATNKAPPPKNAAARSALYGAISEICRHLAEAIVRDGEGAQKLITIEVSGAKSRAQCRRVAESIAGSPLVKTAFAAADANVGRLLMAIGNAKSDFDPKALQLFIDDLPVIDGGGVHPRYDEAKADKLLQRDEFTVRVVLGDGASTVRLKTCDLTHRYIEINAAYRS